MALEKKVLEKLAEILVNSKYTVVLSGYGMIIECGYPALRDGDISYDIEQKYGYSLEELLHSSFYSTRKELFFDFYRNEILKPLDIPPGKGFQILKEMEDEGLVGQIITRRIFGLPQRAGCKNVINLHGSVYNNHCPHCGKAYPMEYIRDSTKVPLCEVCNTPIKPDIVLFGEQVDNSVITRAAEEVSKADVLLVLGTKLSSALCRQLTGYYEGSKLILITLYPHYSDKLADMVINQRVDDTLEELITYMKKKRND